MLQQHECGDYVLEWDVSGEPFVTAKGALVPAVDAALESVLRKRPVHDTGGGTSDGRFFAAAGCQVVELGVVNASIHRINEHVRSADLDVLHTLYYDIIRRLLIDKS
jgi:succinyl-diaminopimelate desuccinylase